MDSYVGKVRLYGSSGTVSITSPKGFSRSVALSGTFTDVVLQGMEEYTFSMGGNSETVILNINDFVEITL